jgi:hypothetical protein
MNTKKTKRNKKTLKEKLRTEHDRGIHEAYEAMSLGQDRCYCEKCYKKREKEFYGK